MTAPADLILENADVHARAEPGGRHPPSSEWTDEFERGTDAIDGAAETDGTDEAVAIRDGEVVRVTTDYEAGFLRGVETDVIDLDGRVLLPGFVDAHTHLETVGRRLVHADLSDAGSPDECVALLRASARDDPDREWILGYGYDESGWEETRYLTREDLDRVSTDRPVVAFREDMHTAGVNATALESVGDELPDEGVHARGGEPTGVLVERALDPLYEAIEPDYEGARELLLAAQERANSVGVTGVHEMVRRSHAPQVYRDLERTGDLTLRVVLNYWSDHLDALEEVGLRTNHGSEFVRVGAIKTYTDGSVGGRTAKLAEPYVDAADTADVEDTADTTDTVDTTASDAAEPTEPVGGGSDEDDLEADETGRWVVPPARLRALVRRADDAGFQVAAHAIGDAAIDAVISAYAAESDDPARARHRIEHAELLTDALIDRLASVGAVASVQPNFLKWADEGGLYDARLGEARRRRTNRYRDLLEAGVPLAFGSDCMPLDPLFGIHRAVNAPDERQRLSVTEALRAYTVGAAYAGFDEGRSGTIEPGKRADLVALSGSPWAHPESIDDLEVVLTVVDGSVVYDGR